LGSSNMSERVQEIFEKKIRKVARAYENDTDIATIAKAVGVSAPTVAKWLTKEGYRRKKRGRIPLAMKARVRDLHQRGWEDDAICSLLELDPSQVEEWSRPQENPILGGESDPLKVRGLKAKKKPGQSRRPRKHRNRGGGIESALLPAKEDKDKGWPPPKHKCGKHWKPAEESYVLSLIEKGVGPGAIYKRMRASRARQIKVWRKSGGDGLPPNFPPPKDFTPDPNMVRRLESDRSEAKRAEDEALERIRDLEEAALERQVRIQELEASAAVEENKIRLLELAQKRLSLDRAAREVRLEQAQAALDMGKRREHDSSELPRAHRARERVLPGSFEHEVLELEPGSIARPPKPEVTDYADNGSYFVVSNDWADLEDATRDELEVVAHFLTKAGFNASVETSGDQPRAYYDSTWPKRIEDKWVATVGDAVEFLNKYRDRRKTLLADRMETKPIIKYLVHAYLGSPDMLDSWAAIPRLDRFVLVFHSKIADLDGNPTAHGVVLGQSAARLIEQRSAERQAKERAREEKRAMKKSEQDEVNRILFGGRRAIGPSDDEEDDDDEG
jgi:hypothetical protein